MGQGEILIELEKKLDQLNKEIEKVDNIDEMLERVWENSFKKEDFINIIGVSLKSVSVSLRKLILQDKIVELKHEKNKVKKRWMLKDDNILDLVNNRRD